MNSFYNVLYRDTRSYRDINYGNIWSRKFLYRGSTNRMLWLYERYCIFILSSSHLWWLLCVPVFVGGNFHTAGTLSVKSVTLLRGQRVILTQCVVLWVSDSCVVKVKLLPESREALEHVSDNALIVTACIIDNIPTIICACAHELALT